MKSQHLQVIFGTGPLAQSVMRALLAKGETRIRLVNRSGKRAMLPQAVEVVGSDAYNAEKVADVTQGAAVVYQCAQPEYTEWPEKFPPLQRAIVEGVSRNDATLIVGENLYMYGPVKGPIHEGLPYAATGHKGRTRAMMSQELLDAFAAGKLRVAMARGSDFFGEGVLASLHGERFFPNLIQGKPASVLGDPDVPHSATYIGDFGKAMVILGEREEALGRAWHVPNAPAVSLRVFAQKAGEQLGTEGKVSPMPKLMFNVISLVHPMLREMRELRYEFEEAYIVDHSDFVAAFGDIHTPLDEAIAHTIAWYKQHLAVEA